MNPKAKMVLELEWQDEQKWTGDGQVKNYLKGNSITSASTVNTDPRLMSFTERTALWIFMKVTFDSNLSWNPCFTTSSLYLWKNPFILLR